MDLDSSEHFFGKWKENLTWLRHCKWLNNSYLSIAIDPNHCFPFWLPAADFPSFNSSLLRSLNWPLLRLTREAFLCLSVFSLCNYLLSLVFKSFKSHVHDLLLKITLQLEGSALLRNRGVMNKSFISAANKCVFFCSHIVIFLCV